MHTSSVEIYSDTSNFAVMRHPGRRFPGCLIQGDSLHIMCAAADEACALAKAQGCMEAFDVMNELRDQLWARLSHDKQVLTEHDIPLPFSE